jgi:hypothetical protein
MKKPSQCEFLNVRRCYALFARRRSCVLAVVLVVTAPNRISGSARSATAPRVPAERQGGPGEEQVHTAPAVLHAKMPATAPTHAHAHSPLFPIGPGLYAPGPRATVSSRQKNIASCDCDTASCTKSQPKATASSREQPRANESKPRSPERTISCLFPLSHLYVILDDNPFLVHMHAV